MIDNNTGAITVSNPFDRETFGDEGYKYSVIIEVSRIGRALTLGVLGFTILRAADFLEGLSNITLVSANFMAHYGWTKLSWCYFFYYFIANFVNWESTMVAIFPSRMEVSYRTSGFFCCNTSQAISVSVCYRSRVG